MLEGVEAIKDRAGQEVDALKELGGVLALRLCR